MGWGEKWRVRKLHCSLALIDAVMYAVTFAAMQRAATLWIRPLSFSSSCLLHGREHTFSNRFEHTHTPLKPRLLCTYWYVYPGHLLVVYHFCVWLALHLNVDSVLVPIHFPLCFCMFTPLSCFLNP